MALPGNHTFNTVELPAYSPSIGGTPIAAQTAAPFRGKLLKIRCITMGIITTADATMTMAVNGTSIGTFTVTVSGAAAGQLFSGVPSTFANQYVNEDDIITITPSGASGSNIAAQFIVTLRTA